MLPVLPVKLHVYDCMDHFMKQCILPVSTWAILQKWLGECYGILLSWKGARSKRPAYKTKPVFL